MPKPTRRARGPIIGRAREERLGHYCLVGIKKILLPFMLVGLMIAGEAEAHAPIEWSDPPNDSVLRELPEKVTVRFAEEPKQLSVKTIEQAPKKGIELDTKRVRERTYEIPLPKTLVTREDGTVVMMIETVGSDGHKEGGVFLLHVKNEETVTTTKPKPTLVTTVPLPTEGTTAPVPFKAPAKEGADWWKWASIVVAVGMSGATYVMYSRMKRAQRIAADAKKAARRKKR